MSSLLARNHEIDIFLWRITLQLQRQKNEASFMSKSRDEPSDEDQF